MPNVNVDARWAALGHYDEYVDMSKVQSKVHAEESAPRLRHRRPSRRPAQQTTGGYQTLCGAGEVREVAWAIHLPRKAEHKLFMKVASDRKHVTHVAKLRAIEELESLKPFLREAYEHSIS
jgi:hypothetical protein